MTEDEYIALTQRYARQLAAAATAVADGAVETDMLVQQNMAGYLLQLVTKIVCLLTDRQDERAMKSDSGGKPVQR